MTVLLIVFLFKKEEEIKPLTRPSGHFVLDLLVTQRAYGDLDTARAAHALKYNTQLAQVLLFFKPLTCPSDHFVLDFFITQRTYGDLDTARAAHTLMLTRVQRDVRLGGTADSTGQPHPFQGLLQMATPTSL